jgi:DNA-binding PadR family transcriptional regulator
MHYRTDPRRHQTASHPRPSHRNRHGRGRGPGGPRGPRARRGDVRAAILALLSEKPMHGYEMLKELEERTEGVWRPSAGSIYPTLQLLEDEGLIEGTEDEGKRRFTLTEAGTEQAAKRESDSTPWEEVSAGAGADRAKLGLAAHQLSSAVGQVFHAASPQQRERVTEILDQARRSIYGILAESESDTDQGSGAGS